MARGEIPNGLLVPDPTHAPRSAHTGAAHPPETNPVSILFILMLFFHVRGVRRVRFSLALTSLALVILF